MTRFSPTQLAALDLDRSFVVRAGAGSGKTTLLVERIARQLQRDAETGAEGGGGILALTFTDKAAIEMRGRLRDRLVALGRAPDGAFRSLARVELSTIHAFAGRLVRRHASRLGVDPAFEIADPGALRHRFGELTDDLLLRAEWDEPALVRPLAQVLDRPGVVATLRALFDKRPDSATWARSVARWGSLDEYRVHASAERDAMFRGLAAGFAGDREARELRRRIAQVLPESPPLVAPKLADALAAIDGGLASVAGVSALRALVDDLILKLNRGKTGWRAFSASKELAPFIDVFKDHLKLIRPADDLDRLDWLADVAIYHLGVLFLRAIEEYQRIQRREGFLDFSDLATRAVGLLESDAEVARDERARYRHVLVDELQDTDAEQWRLVQAVAALHGDAGETGTMFLVGDEKQSIYGFRGADVSVVARAADVVLAHGGGQVVLAENYRSRARLLAVIDATFARVFAPANLSVHAPYEARPQPLVACSGDGGVVRILASRVVPPPEHKHDPSAARVLEHPDALEARAIAREVLRLRDRGRAFEDIAILLRTRTRLQGIVSALEAAGIPHVTWRGSGFFERSEVADALAIARVLLDPADAISLLGALRSPTFALSDAALLALHQAGAGSLDVGLARLACAATRESESTSLLDVRDRHAVARAHALIVRGRAIVRSTPLAATLRELFEGGGTFVALAAAPDGDQRIANVEKLLDLFRTQQDRGASARTALEIVEGQAGGESPEGLAPLDLDRRAGVRLMTVHSAKGLEFPVVIVPGIDDKVATAKSDRLLLEELPGIGPRLGLSIPDDMLAEHGIRAFAGSSAKTRGAARAMSSTRQAVVDRTSRREKAEAKRVLYVACTRAQEELVLVATLELGKRGNYQPTYFHPLTWWTLLAPAWGLEVGIEPARTHLELDGERIEIAWGDPGPPIDPRRAPPPFLAAELSALERDEGALAPGAMSQPRVSPLAIEPADIDAFLACPLSFFHRQVVGEMPCPPVGGVPVSLPSESAILPHEGAAPDLAAAIGKDTATWSDVPLATAMDLGRATVSARADHVWRDGDGRWCVANATVGGAARASSFLPAWILASSTRRAPGPGAPEAFPEPRAAVGLVVARDARGGWLRVEGDELRTRLEALDDTLERMVHSDFAPPSDPPCARCAYASAGICDRAETWQREQNR